MMGGSSNAIYALEDGVSGHCAHTTGTRCQLESLAAEVCAYYGTSVPNIRFINTRRNTHIAWFDHEIVLNRAREGANGITLLHELSHFLTAEFYTDVEHHGPEFAAIYMHLLDRWKYLPNRCFRLLAKQHRLKIGRRYRPRAFVR
jgi:predicted SprT family Zn-dependent metalloprotease